MVIKLLCGILSKFGAIYKNICVLKGTSSQDDRACDNWVIFYGYELGLISKKNHAITIGIWMTASANI